MPIISANVDRSTFDAIEAYRCARRRSRAIEDLLRQALNLPPVIPPLPRHPNDRPDSTLNPPNH